MYSLKVLRNIQRRAALWILEAFHTSPSSGIKATMCLILIHLYVQKLNSGFHFRAYTLLVNYIIKLLLKTRLTKYTEAHQLLLERLMPKQWANIRGPIIDTGNRFNKIILSFSLFKCEFSLENRFINIFPNHFSFHSLNKKSKNSIKNCLHNLDNITLQVSTDLHSVVVVLDASIKNHITTSIAHIHVYDSPVIKMIHHTVNVMSTKSRTFCNKMQY